jgi:hypothetical protein
MLVYQSLFVTSDAGMSIAQQQRLSARFLGGVTLPAVRAGGLNGGVDRLCRGRIGRGV